MNRVFEQVIRRLLAGAERGCLTLKTPDGRTHRFGGLGKDLLAEIHVHSDDFFRRCVLFGPIGFAESYMDEQWTTPDLVRVIAWFILNGESTGVLESRAGRRRGPWVNLLNKYNRLIHLRRPNSRRMAQTNIRNHYDLGNEFFRLWLDPTLTYSSAYFDPPNLSLEAAQQKKYDVLCRKLHISPSDHVLEIGTGWGGFSLRAAGKFGAKVTTITLSREQHDETTRRIAAAGLADRVTVLLRDYREVSGSFDKIASIEMIEAVGDRYLEDFFAACHRALKPDGLLGIQMITCPNHQYPVLRDGVDFIQKYIFPGSLLVSQKRVTEAMDRTGTLNLHHWEDMGYFYAKTINIWTSNFNKEYNALKELGFNDRFLRKWRYYLAYCEAAFGMRHISVVQAIYTRPNNLRIPAPARSPFPEVSS